MNLAYLLEVALLIFEDQKKLKDLNIAISSRRGQGLVKTFYGQLLPHNFNNGLNDIQMAHGSGFDHAIFYEFQPKLLASR